MTPVQLRNLVRGGRGFHSNRHAILRACISGQYRSDGLTPYLLGQLFELPSSGWAAFSFTKKDWDIADLLIKAPSPKTERALLSVLLAYIQSNLDSVTKLYAMADVISSRVLKNEAVDLAPGTDMFSTSEAQSLFSFRVICGSFLSSPQEMRDRLETTMLRGSWAHTRLMFPLLNLVSNARGADDLDDFLAYFTVGDERPAEKLAIKLLLSDMAAREAPLSFKLLVGLLGHPYDACELLLDHAEYQSLRCAPLPDHLQHALDTLRKCLPATRVERVARAPEALRNFSADGPSAADVENAVAPFGLGALEVDLLAKFMRLEPMPHEHVVVTSRPLLILANMRTSEYPEPVQFSELASARALWSFVDGGRLIGALMRTIYMVDRAAFELEARDVLRLASFFGAVNPMLASAPSAMALIKRAGGTHDSRDEPRDVEAAANTAIAARMPLQQRLWINELQWRLRRLEDEGRIQAWLQLVRSDAKVRPLYLTGINWPWVESVIEQQRLRPFRSFDGAYLLLLMEMETNSDPQRFKLVLDGLLSGMDFERVVATILNEYGDKAPAVVRRYFTSANLLSTGLATNHLSSLDLRLKAIEESVRTLGFSPLLTRDMWEAETKLLTTEILLFNVNAGKFEVPWATFQKDEVDRHSELYSTFRNMTVTGSEEALTGLVDTPKIFKNGRKLQYRYRRSNALLFQLVVQVVEDFLDHPAFGLEIVLSGRFRHNIVLHELQAALAAVEALVIPPVTNPNKHRLIADYRPVLERILFSWCSRRLHSKRDDKPEALFDLIPTPAEMSQLLNGASELPTFEELVGFLTEWLKSKLRVQVEAAGKTFVADLRGSLNAAFDALCEQQVETASVIYRPDDAKRIHKAVTEAVLRRVEDLEIWFSGVDTTTAERVTLVQLGHATERLLENVIPGKRLSGTFDFDSADVLFEPHEAKVAFDLVREIVFNALKHGPDGEVSLIVTHVPASDPVTFEFENAISGEAPERTGDVRGHRYDSPAEALTRDKNSGRFKIAASAATLCGKDVDISWRLSADRYSLVVPLRQLNADGEK